MSWRVVVIKSKLLIHIELCEKYLKKKLFIILNLHSCCSQEELNYFFKDAVYRKKNGTAKNFV